MHGGGLGWYKIQISTSQNVPTYTLLTILNIQNWKIKPVGLNLNLKNINSNTNVP